MEQNRNISKIFESAHLMVLISYTIFSMILIGEATLLGWEVWVLPLILASVIVCWGLHITQALTQRIRTWIFAIQMMVTFFFYGIHLTSTFDIATVMAALMILYTTTDERNLITLCLITYYATLGYDIAQMISSGESFDQLVITRTMLHVVIIATIWWICQNIMKKWHETLYRSETKIRELKEATERMDDFMVNISHEIRTPMNAVVGLSTVMIKDAEDAKQKKGLERILDAGHRVSSQVGDILDHTEIDMGRLSVNREAYMLSSVVSDLIAQVKPLKPEGQELVIDVDTNVPGSIIGDAEKIKKILWHLITNGFKFTKEGGVYVYISCDKKEYGINLQIEVRDTGIGMTEDEIDRIFERFYQSDSGRTRKAGGLGLGINIVQGFVKAMGGFLSISSEPEVGTRVFVSIPQVVEDDVPCIDIRDPELFCMAGFVQFATIQHPLVREYYALLVRHLSENLKIPFYWADSIEHLKKIKSVYRLTHLFVGETEYLENKAFLEKLTDEMEVSVFADELFKVDEGSHIRLLRKPLSPFTVMGFKHGKKMDAYSGEKKMSCPGINALVVDDEPMNLFVATDILSGYGMIVDTAGSGAESIKMYEEKDYDIIFMDHMMPEMDGIEAMKRLKAIRKGGGRDATVVALTANAVSSAKEMFLNEGFDGFVPKPIELYDLERVLKHVLPKSAIVYTTGDEEVIEEPLPGTEDDKEEIREMGLLEELTSAGVDVAIGLKYCKGDAEFFNSLLIEYAKSAIEKEKLLRAAYEAKDLENYAIHIHAVKSTSKMIGASELFTLARELEDAAKAEDMTLVTASNDSVLAKYHNIVDVICKYLEVPADGSDDEVLEFSASGDDEVIEFAPEDE